MFGSRCSAPVSRAMRTPRVASACQSSSSQRSCARRHASHSQRWSSAAAAGLAERAQRLREWRDGRRVALGEPRHECIEERARPRPATATGATRARPRRPRARPGRCRGARRTSPPRTPRGRSRGPSRRPADRAAWLPRAAAAARRARAGSANTISRAQPLQPRALELVDRPERGDGQQLGRGRRRRRRRASPARRRASARRARRGRASARPPAAGTRRPRPARPRACARPAERASSGGDGLVRRRGGVRAMPGAAVGIELRIGRLGERAMHVAAVTRGRRAVDRRADERMREPHARAELDQPGGLRRARGLGADPEALGGAPQQARVAQRLGRGRQQQELRVARKRRRRAAGSRARCGSPTSAPSGIPNPPASSAGVIPRGSSISASGLPPASARIRALHALVERPGDRRVQQHPGVAPRPGPRPRAPAALEPMPVAGARAARTPMPAAPPAAGAPRTTSVCADTRSSHCASSTMHTSGCCSAASASRLSTASPTRKRSGAAPALRPNAVLQRVALRLWEVP